MPRTSGRSRKPPFKNTEWRDDCLYARVRIRGKKSPVRWSLGFRHPLRDSDVESAREAVAEGIRRLKAEAYGHHTDRVRYEDMAAAWLERHIMHQVGSKTAKRYASSLTQLDPFLKDIFWDEIDREKVGTIVDARRADGVHPRSIRNDLTALSSVFKFAQLDDGENPALFWYKRIKVKREPIVLPDIRHVDRVIKRCPPGLASIARAAMLTGCRQEELVTAEVSRLDVARRQLTVIGKGNKLRTLEIDSAACDYLAGLPKALGCRWLFWHPEPLRDVTNRIVKGHYTSEPYRNVSSRFSGKVRDELAAAEKAADKAGHAHPDFRLFRFHDLRHLFAVNWLKAGRSIYDLQQHLGHTSVKTTEIYLEYLTPEEKRSVMYGPQQSQPQPTSIAMLKPREA